MKAKTFEEIQTWASVNGYSARLPALARKLLEEVDEFTAELGKPLGNPLNEAADICIVLAAHFGKALEDEIASKMFVNEHERKWFVKPDGTLGRIKP